MDFLPCLIDLIWGRRLLLLVNLNLIGVNKGIRVTLKYFRIFIKIDKEHIYFIGPGLLRPLVANL